MGDRVAEIADAGVSCVRASIERESLRIIPPDPSPIGDVSFPFNPIDRLPSCWLVMEANRLLLPWLLCGWLRLGPNPLPFSWPPKPAPCIMLPSLDCPISPFAFLLNGGNSSMEPVLG